MKTGKDFQVEQKLQPKGGSNRGKVGVLVAGLEKKNEQRGASPKCELHGGENSLKDKKTAQKMFGEYKAQSRIRMANKKHTRKGVVGVTKRP